MHFITIKIQLITIDQFLWGDLRTTSINTTNNNNSNSPEGMGNTNEQSTKERQ